MSDLPQQSTQLTEEQIHALENFAGRICSRPTLYTPHGTLREVLATMFGYEIGIREAFNRREETMCEQLPTIKVNRWLLKSFGEDVEMSVLDKYGTEKAALEAIAAHAKTCGPDREILTPNS